MLLTAAAVLWYNPPTIPNPPACAGRRRMKLRHPWLIKATSRGAAWLLRAWMCTLRYQYHPLGTNAEPPQVPDGTRYIYTFWHEYLLLPAFRYAFTDATVLIGQHADGQLI